MLFESIKKNIGFLSIIPILLSILFIMIQITYGKTWDYYTTTLPLIVSLCIILFAGLGIISGVIGLIIQQIIKYKKLQTGLSIVSILFGLIISFSYIILLMIIFKT